MRIWVQDEGGATLTKGEKMNEKNYEKNLGKIK